MTRMGEKTSEESTLVGRLEKGQERLEALQRKGEEWGGAIGMPLVLGAVCRYLVVWTGGLHWSIGLVVALVLIASVWFLLRGLHAAVRSKANFRHLAACFLTVVAVGASAFAGISFLLHSHLDLGYASRSELTPGRFSDMYLWILFDMIPSLDIPEALHIGRPIETTRFLAGIPDLAFKAIVVLPLIAVAQMWFGMPKTSAEKKSGASADA